MPPAFGASFAPGWLTAALALHVLNQVARACGWWALVRRTVPAGALRRQDVLAAWVAGSGAGGVASARGADAVRLLLVSTRTRDAPWGRLAGTLVVESAGETVLAVATVAAAVALGAWSLPAWSPADGLVFAGAAAILAGAVWSVRRRPRAQRLARDVRAGVAATGSCAGYARAVLPWQLASRGLRAGALVCALQAFALPVLAGAVVLLLVAEGGGRLVPFAPAGAATTAAILVAGAPGATGGVVAGSALAACFLAFAAARTLLGIALSAVLVVRFVPVRTALRALTAGGLRRWWCGARRRLRPGSTAAP